MQSSARLILEMTTNYLHEQLSAHHVLDPENILQAYQPRDDVDSGQQFMRELVHTSYNRGMAQNVIGRKVKARHTEFDELLCHYDSLKLLARWGIDGEDAVYGALISAGIAPQPNGAKAVLWRTFSRSIIGSAHFLADYKYNDLKRDIDTKNTLAVLGGFS